MHFIERFRRTVRQEVSHIAKHINFNFIALFLGKRVFYCRIALRHIEKPHALIQVLPKHASWRLLFLGGMEFPARINIRIGQHQLSCVVRIFFLARELVYLTRLVNQLGVFFMFLMGVTTARVFGHRNSKRQSHLCIQPCFRALKRDIKPTLLTFRYRRGRGRRRSVTGCLTSALT